MRMRKGHIGLVALVAIVVLGLVIAVFGGDDDSDNGGNAAKEAPTQAAASSTITEDNLPAGFTAAPTIELAGKKWTFDKIPGHYWKVLDDSGVAVGLHFQSEKPFKWAQDVPKGELLYMVYAIPGNCGDGSFAKAVKSKNASAVGKLPAGFDHWHALVGGGSKTGHWLMHTAVRDFALAGPPENPMTGTKVKAGNPGFMPVCDIR